MRATIVGVVIVLSACSAGTECVVTMDSGAIGETRTYILSGVTVGRYTEMPGYGRGLDLDHTAGGIPGEPCTQWMDYVSPVTGAADVDDQFAGFGIDGMFQRAIQSGALLLLFQVTGINSYTSDTSVNVHTFLGAVRPGETLHLDGAGLAVGQSFVIARDLGTVPAAIVEARLVLDTRAEVPFLFVGSAPVPLRGLQLTANIDPTVLSFGMLGGYLTIDDVVALEAAVGVTVDRTAAQSSADLLPEPGGAVCDGISLGASFGAVAAQLVPCP